MKRFEIDSLNNFTLTGGNSNWLISQCTQIVASVDELSAAEIYVYPSPTNGILHFDVPATLEASVCIINSLGQIVYKSPTIPNEIQLDVAPGLYTVEFQSKTSLRTIKVAKY